MKAQIEKEIAELDEAFKMKLISTNDYCTMLHTLLKKLKTNNHENRTIIRSY